MWIFFQAKVSNTIGKIVAFKAGLVVIIAALIGAIIWNLVTWYLGLPSSSTHALVGALSGAAIAAAHGLGGVRAAEFWKTVLSLVISPPVGFLLAAIFMTVLLATWAEGVPLWKVAQVWSFAKKMGVMNRFIWGTDYPYVPFTNGLELFSKVGAYTQKHELEPFITAEDQAGFFGDNAGRLLGLRESVEVSNGPVTGCP